MNDIELCLVTLKIDMEFRSPHVINNANLVLQLFPREALPDWVEILANGNPAELEAVIETALADMQEVNDDNDNL